MAPRLGRGFTRDELGPGGSRVAVLSHRIWQNRFGGEADLRRAIHSRKRRARDRRGASCLRTCCSLARTSGCLSGRARRSGRAPHGNSPSWHGWRAGMGPWRRRGGARDAFRQNNGCVQRSTVNTKTGDSAPTPLGRSADTRPMRAAAQLLVGAIAFLLPVRRRQRLEPSRHSPFDSST